MVTGVRPLTYQLIDRIEPAPSATMVEPELEKHFHEDSYGYRPNKSAVEAVGVARKRCWRYDWVLDMDIIGTARNIRNYIADSDNSLNVYISCEIAEDKSLFLKMYINMFGNKEANTPDENIREIWTNALRWIK